MNQKNYEYLKDQVKYAGFGDGLNDKIKMKLNENAPQFNIIHETKMGNDPLSATLHFKKSEQHDMYFFNKYDVEVKGPDNVEKLRQTFYINKGNNITLKEAFNLLSGRAVNKDLTNKEGQVYNAWLQLDFKQTEPSGNYKVNHYHQNYGYDLGIELRKLSIKELLGSQEHTAILQSLQKGNLQPVTMADDTSSKKVFIEANPQFKTINVYDSEMKKLEKVSMFKGKSFDSSKVKEGGSKKELGTNQATPQGIGEGDTGDLGKSNKHDHRQKRTGHSL